MIKRTLYFGNSAYLSLKNNQLVVQFPSDREKTALPGNHTVPIEDIGLVILDARQITLTHGLISALIANKCLIVSCDETHHPTGLMHSMDGHTEQSKRFAAQFEASEPLKKNLWQQTVAQKLKNQALHLRERNRSFEPLLRWSKEVRSGDPDNLEGRGAAHYWGHIFHDDPFFNRDRHGHPPNAWLNYGYGLLRASMARAIVGSGLHPTAGIHHRNKYNAFCLADDLMEPYRVVVDQKVCQMMDSFEPVNTLSKDHKISLLGVLSEPVKMGTEISPVQVAMQRTVHSLVRCYLGEKRNLELPEIPGS